MIQFLYQGGHGSHQPRAQALANLSPGSRVGDIATTKASAIAGLDTLTIWGHGESTKLCGMLPKEIFDCIVKWKKLNSGLKTVEIITCNARHCSGGGHPFTSQLKSKFGILSGTNGITLKALPVTVSGKMNAWSILLAETVHNSWCYITAPGADDTMLMGATKLIQYYTNDLGKSVSYKGDIAQRADEMVRANPTRQWTMNYGYFNTLRACLGKVR